MSDALVRSIFGIECNTNVRDADGIEWTVSVVEGWGSTDIRTAQVSPSGRHGLALGSSFRGGKAMRVQGLALGIDQDAGWIAYNRLLSVLDLNQSGEVIGYEPVPKKVDAVLWDAPLVSVPKGGVVAWDLSLMASFPFKTALTPTVTSLAGGGSTTLTNAGNTAAYPVITTTSSGTVDLVIGGRHFTTGTLPSGAVVDMWERTLVNGSGDPLPAAKTPESEWLALPVGATGVDQDGTAALSISHFATFN